MLSITVCIPWAGAFLGWAARAGKHLEQIHDTEGHILTSGYGGFPLSHVRP